MSLKQSMLSVSTLMASVAVLLMGNGLLGTLIPVRANLEAFSGIDIGILGSFYFVGFTLGCVTGPLLIARVGHIRTYLAFVAVAAIAALVHVLATDVWVWWLTRATTGFSFSVLFIVIESWLNERSDNETRGTVLSIYMVINLTVLMLGQLMLTLADPRSFSLFVVAAILFLLAALPVAMTRAQSPNPIPVVWPRLMRLYRVSPVGAVVCFAVGLANGAFWSIGPLFPMDRGFGTPGIAFFMSAVVLGGAIGQWPLGRLSDTVDRRYVILAAALSAGLAGLALSHLFARQFKFAPDQLSRRLAEGNSGPDKAAKWEGPWFDCRLARDVPMTWCGCSRQLAAGPALDKLPEERISG